VTAAFERASPQSLLGCGTARSPEEPASIRNDSPDARRAGGHRRSTARLHPLGADTAADGSCDLAEINVRPKKYATKKNVERRDRWHAWAV